MFKISNDYLGIILLEMTIQGICFTKSSLTYSSFLHQASLNNWNKKWHEFYYHTSFYLLSLPGLWQSPGGGWGQNPCNTLTFFSSGGQINSLK